MRQQLVVPTLDKHQAPQASTRWDGEPDLLPSKRVAVTASAPPSPPPPPLEERRVRMMDTETNDPNDLRVDTWKKRKNTEKGAPYRPCKADLSAILETLAALPLSPRLWLASPATTWSPVPTRQRNQSIPAAGVLLPASRPATPSPTQRPNAGSARRPRTSSGAHARRPSKRGGRPIWPPLRQHTQPRRCDTHHKVIVLVAVLGTPAFVYQAPRAPTKTGNTSACNTCRRPRMLSVFVHNRRFTAKNSFNTMATR